jgi:hypothetical protein
VNKIPHALIVSAGLTLVPLASFADAQTVTPASFVEDTGSAERIESGDTLRIYSQQVAAAACFFYNGVDPELSIALLQEARSGFDVHMAALRDGDADLGIIGGEERRKTLVKMDEVQYIWSDMAQAVDALLADSDDTDAVSVIKDQNMALLEKTDILLTQLEGQYANPVEIVQADVLTLEIVGRQAMMTQKIAKNVCKVWSGRDTPEIREQLTSAIGIYEIALNALINGMPEVGLRPAPTEEIADDLSGILADWKDVRPIVEAILAGDTNEDELVYLFHHMADEMHKLEDVTHKYVVESKHDY